MLRLDCGPHIVLPPTHIIPHATKKSPATSGYAARMAQANTTFNLELGEVEAPIKLPDLLIRAFAALPREIEADLVFAGGCGTPLKDQLLRNWRGS